MKGYTLLELIIVIAVISVLTLIGTIRFNQFQKDTNVNLVTNELISQIKTARIKSMAGEIIEGEKESDFEEGGLPVYGIDLNDNTYALFREYQLFGDADITRQVLETTTLDSSYNLTGDAEVIFERISGEGSAIFILEKENVPQREIDIKANGIIEINKL